MSDEHNHVPKEEILGIVIHQSEPDLRHCTVLDFILNDWSFEEIHLLDDFFSQFEVFIETKIKNGLENLYDLVTYLFHIQSLHRALHYTA